MPEATCRREIFPAESSVPWRILYLVASFQATKAVAHSAFISDARLELGWTTGRQWRWQGELPRGSCARRPAAAYAVATRRRRDLARRGSGRGRGGRARRAVSRSARRTPTWDSRRLPVVEDGDDSVVEEKGMDAKRAAQLGRPMRRGRRGGGRRSGLGRDERGKEGSRAWAGPAMAQVEEEGKARARPDVEDEVRRRRERGLG